MVDSVEEEEKEVMGQGCSFCVERSEVVVNSDEVETYSQRGYRTLDIREEDVSTVQSVNDQQVFSGNTYPTQVPKQVPVVLRILRFHMARRGASQIAQLSVMLESVQNECAALKTKVADGDKVISALKTGSDVSARTAEGHLVDLVNEKKLSADLRDSARKMEATVAKIRKEIGEQRWREITADPRDPKNVLGEKTRIASLDLDDAPALAIAATRTQL